MLSRSTNHRQMRASLIDAYFYHYHTAYPIIHEATFRAQYNEVIPKPGGSAWTLLRNTIISIGAWCLGDNLSGTEGLFGLDPNSGNNFPDTFSSANLTMVQALALWSNYMQRQNKPNTSWNYQGIAVRMALSLGLHKEFPAWNISLLDREVRRRVWWYIYIVDSGASMTYGRPVLLPEPHLMDIKPLLNVHDDVSLSHTSKEMISNSKFQCLTAATTEPPDEANEPTLYSSVLMQVKFHLIANPMYARRLGCPDLEVDEVLSMNSKLDSWMSTLPAYFQEGAPLESPSELLTMSRYRFFWRVRNFRMVLLWPVLINYTEKTHRAEEAKDTEKERSARQLCLKYAHDTITSIDEYFSSKFSSRLGDWYAL